MSERFEVVLMREVSPGKWRAAARWPHSREACDVAVWAAQLTGGKAVIVGVKEFEI